MADTQDSTAELLRKARERRIKKASSNNMADDIVCSPATKTFTIASGITSPNLARKNCGGASAIFGETGRDMASGVAGAKITPKPEVKMVAIDDVEDDFESLQEQMSSRFRRNLPDYKENLISTKVGVKSTHALNISTSRTPLSPSKADNVFPQNKKFFANIEADKTIVQKNSTSEVWSSFKNTKPTENLDDVMKPTPTTRERVLSPKKSDQTLLLTQKNAELSPTKESPSKAVLTSTKEFPTTAVLFLTKKPLSPPSPAKKHAPVKTHNSFHSHLKAASPRKESGFVPLSPNPIRVLKTAPSVRAKPNNLVMKRLAQIEGRATSPDEEPTPSPVKEEAPTFALVPTPVKNVTLFKRSPTPEQTGHVTPEDSMFIKCNMNQIHNNINDNHYGIQPTVEEKEEEQEELLEDEKKENYEEMEIVVEMMETNGNKLNGDFQKRDVLQEDVGIEKVSFDDLCNSVMPGSFDLLPPPVPSTTDNVTEERRKEESYISDDWLDFTTPAVPPSINTSLKRDVDSLFSSVESFIGADLASSTLTTALEVRKTEKRTVLSPVKSDARNHSLILGPKKLRRSMSVSDIRETNSPARFVRIDELRSSSTSLRSPSSEYEGSSYMAEEKPIPRRPRTNTHRGPLHEGTLELRPPFDQIKVLEQGVMVQGQLQTQASQVLEHCNWGLEQVEAEKVLLTAGLKKDLWNRHLTSLKEEGHAFSSDTLPKGHLEIREISLLLRQDYLVSQVVEKKVNQAFFVVAKVIPYRLLTTNTATSECNIHGTTLTISEPIVIENLPPDYQLTLEIYCMSYNMHSTNTPIKKKRLETNTPKRLLQSALSRMGASQKRDRAFTSSMESFRERSGSVGAPKTSCSSSSTHQGPKFILAGTLNITIKDVKTKQFRLRKAPFHSPFEGTISLNMSAKESVNSPPPSHKGFLTIFQEESGLGAWNRRWCSVQDNKIYYWLYPEDQVNRNKVPHGEIDLRHCKTDRVAIASRLDCARPNTFVLTVLKPAQPGDRSSIITESNGKTTQTKFLLSADSREERREWMDVINRSLQCVVSWNH